MRSILIPAMMVTSLLGTHCVVAKVIDLSHKHTPSTLMSLHGAPGYNLTTLFAGEYMPGIYAESNYYGSSEHGGTHMDAPSHFTKGGMTLDEIPLEKTIVDGVMIDCSKEVASNTGYAVTVQKLLDWESEHGQIPQRAAVLFNFNWSSRFDNETLYRGTADVDNRDAYLFPYVSFEAGKWLLEERDLQMIGTDTLSADIPSITKKGSGFLHQLYLPRNRFMVENLRDLHKLPARGFRFHSSPVKYEKASGAQVRAFAMTFDEDPNNGCDVICASLASVFYLGFLMFKLML